MTIAHTTLRCIHKASCHYCQAGVKCCTRAVAHGLLEICPYFTFLPQHGGPRPTHPLLESLSGWVRVFFYFSLSLPPSFYIASSLFLSLSLSLSLLQSLLCVQPLTHCVAVVCMAADRAPIRAWPLRGRDPLAGRRLKSACTDHKGQAKLSGSVEGHQFMSPE